MSNPERKKPYSLKGRYGYRKSKPPCFNGSYRRKGPKARRVTITLAGQDSPVCEASG